MSDADRVKFLVQPDGWAAFEAYQLDAAQRMALVEAALTEYRDPRAAAAYVLETVAADLAAKAAGSDGAIKRIKIEGEIEIERAATGPSAGSVQAATLAARAAALRREVRRAARSGIVLATPLQVPR